MASKSYKAKAPGTLMLCGEHAVLHGSLAIVCALDKYINVTLTPRSDKIINIDSNLGQYQTSPDNLNIQKPFQFVLTAIRLYTKKLKQGFDLKITADFSEKKGLGSSAAVTVATVSALEQCLHKKPKPLELFEIAKKVILQVQGVGSGADVAASAFNATVAYKTKPLSIKKLAHPPPLTIIYSGSKTPTVKVIKKVDDLRKKHPQIFKAIFTAINNCSVKAITTINNKDWPKLGELMNIHQGLQEAMGTSNETLAKIIFELRQRPEIYGAKISGSGLGDCVIGLGKLKNE